MIEIRELRGMAELHAIEELQRVVWSCSDLEIVPAIHMIPSVHVGAVLLGAFDAGAMIGFVYGFPGVEHGRLILHSDMLAVLPSYRDRGVGRALKLAQRDRARDGGFHAITWTFDPLQARNANVNIAILGATADRYYRDFYGATTSPLHDSGTDRLWITWTADGSRPPTTTPAHRIEIPTNLHPADASAWRIRVRTQFEEAFANGFVVTGFERGPETSAYLLATRDPAARP